ncbi:MAG: DUF3343 domain-containing protein [Kosmotogaceae bacterium]|nr:DUF3343 domain-containing protein [Kosmotogaceae bacterium]
MVDTRKLDGLIVVSQIDITKVISLLRNHGIQTKVFPTPPGLFAGCSLSIAVSSTVFDSVLMLLKQHDVEVILSALCDENPVKSFYD